MTDSSKDKETEYSAEEKQERFLATIRGALKTQPEPRSVAKGKARRPVVAPKAARQGEDKSNKRK